MDKDQSVSAPQTARVQNPGRIPSGSTPVPGVGGGVPRPRTSDENSPRFGHLRTPNESSFQRAAETNARGGRAPQSAREARALPDINPPSSDGAAREARDTDL
jgi:hypothetical protein